MTFIGRLFVQGFHCRKTFLVRNSRVLSYTEYSLDLDLTVDQIKDLYNLLFLKPTSTPTLIFRSQKTRTPRAWMFSGNIF